MAKAYRIHINGIVQGVGFRPFVFKLAQQLNLNGWVNNSSDGLDIHVEGEQVEEFYQRVITEKPPLAFIISLDKEEVPFENFVDFRIMESKKTNQEDVLISPDVATCEDCLRELADVKDKRYGYPFINCTNCGPRYSIIEDRPYDRAKTTMKAFAMCTACTKEYHDPLNRRFHAQPISCYDCGPRLSLLDSLGREIQDKGIGLSLLEEGAILAVKGIGGFHLVCNAYDHEAVRKLRNVKERGAKPFALMAKNIETAAREVRISEQEKSILTSAAAPIVLLPRINISESKLAAEVAPGLHTLGIILPYTPLHHLLFEGAFDFLVMTSANVSGQPLIYENETAFQSLQGIADYFLIHDRNIYHPCDDSVIQVIGNHAAFHRRARGYVPLPIIFKEEKFKVPTAGLGGEMKNAFCLASGKMAFMSQYIGDMHGLANFQRFQQEYDSYQKVANVFPELIACDKHPEYSTTKMAKALQQPSYLIQHHHAHHVSVMGEHHLEQPMLGLICDGTGYGDDGKIWGFEYLFGNAQGFKRLGHLEYLPLPGGDAGAKHPLRIAYAYLQTSLPEEEWEKTAQIWNRLSDQERSILKGQIKSGFQLFPTSSAGRLFDAISGLLGICSKVTYEGQAAIELESAAVQWLERLGSDSRESLFKEWNIRAVERVRAILHLQNNVSSSENSEEVKVRLIQSYNDFAPRGGYPIRLAYLDGEIVLKVDFFLRHLVRDYLDCVAVEEIAFRFHYSLALAMLECALIIGYPGREMVIGGGVFQNKLLTEILLDLAQRAGVKIYRSAVLPAGDGGIALGQVLIANRQLNSSN